MSLKLQPHRFTIEHQKGSANVVADALSRVNCDSVVEFSNGVSVLLNQDDFDQKYFDEPNYKARMAKVESYPSYFLNLQCLDNRLYIRIEPKPREALLDISCWKLWVLEELTKIIISREHDEPYAGHGGITKTLELIRRFYYWPNMATIVLEYVSKCAHCKMSKSTNAVLRPPIGKSYHSERPW